MKAPLMAQAAGQEPARHRRDSSPNLRIHLRGGRADASPTVRWNALLGFKTVDLRPSYRQMRLHRKRQAVPTHVWLQRAIDFTNDGRQGLITQLYPRSPQHRTDHHPPYKKFRRRKARDSLLSAHAHFAEPCDFETRLESLGITKTKDDGHQPCSLGTDVSLQPSS